VDFRKLVSFEAKTVSHAAGRGWRMNSLTVLADRAAVSDLLLELARALDSKDWTICRRCLLDEIETDYSDLRGEPPARVNADDFVAKRRVALERLKTLHLSTNHQVTVDGDRATCVSAGVIHRFRPEDGERFDTYCTYTHSLVRTPAGWKIAKIKQTVHWNTGNPEVHAGAKR
jgi:3-phenylpropionate/cinnamic acid dioxygenase small subunit